MFRSLFTFVTLFIITFVYAAPPKSRCVKGHWGWTNHYFGGNAWGPVLVNDVSFSLPPSHCSKLVKPSSTAVPDNIAAPPSNARPSSVIASSTSLLTAVTLIPVQAEASLSSAQGGSEEGTSSRTATSSRIPTSRSSNVARPTPASFSEDGGSDDEDDEPQTPTARPSSTARARTTARPQSTTRSSPAPSPPARSNNTSVVGDNNGFVQDDDNGGDVAEYLQAHNSVRARHGARPLTWSNELQAAAQRWADRCVFEHSRGQLGRLGENLAAGTNIGIAGGIKLWSDEVDEYNPGNPVASHFTQMVWKGTTNLGCAVSRCSGILSGGPGNFLVCEYSPPGNVLGQFGQNVEV